ncbi:MAG: hypothetical protein ACRD5H_00870 [Nitrososphaerales archaeon]
MRKIFLKSGTFSKRKSITIYKQREKLNQPNEAKMNSRQIDEKINMIERMLSDSMTQALWSLFNGLSEVEQLGVLAAMADRSRAISELATVYS